MSDSATPWTAAYQAPPSMGFSRQEYWSGVPLPFPVNCLANFCRKVGLLYSLLLPLSLSRSHICSSSRYFKGDSLKRQPSVFLLTVHLILRTGKSTNVLSVSLTCPISPLASHVQLFLYSVQWPDGLLIMPCSFTALLLVGRGTEITRAPVSYLHLP